MAAPFPEQSVLEVRKTIDIKAPLKKAFAAMLEQLGPANEMHDGKSMPMKLEVWPGGRWFRDLGDNAGHYWGTVQVIKPPTLLEITGPLFMSYPVMSHVQYRLIEAPQGCRLEFCHRAIGEILPQHREGVNAGWQHFISRIKLLAER